MYMYYFYKKCVFDIKILVTLYSETCLNQTSLINRLN
jgi:hypothetical protein